MSSEESTTVYEESEISTESLEFAQRIPEDMSEEEIDEPPRSTSPLHWKHGLTPTAEQMRVIPAAPQPHAKASEVEQETLLNENVFRGHRLPYDLVGVKSKRWVGTHNTQQYMQDTNDLTLRCMDADVEYMEVYRETAPTTGHLHYHSIVTFTDKVSAFRVFQLDPTAHWEQMKGRITSAFDYMSKGGDKVFQFGRRPALIELHLNRRHNNQGPTRQQLRFEELVARAKLGDETIRDDMLYARYQKYFDQLLIAAFVPQIYSAPLSDKNLWIVGPPGTGKSRLVREYALNNGFRLYNKLQNKWWDGFSDHSIVLIEDADPQTMKLLASHMKVWSDRYPFTAEIKGTARMINATFHFIVTSNYTIEECFNEVDARAIIRRFDVLQMN